jgi:hypothetical protein
MSRFDAFQLGIVAGVLIATFANYCHQRFEVPYRYRRRRVGDPPPPGNPSDWLLTPPPDVAAAINRQLDRDIAIELRRRRASKPPTPPQP